MNTRWVSIMKILQDSFNFFEDDSEKYLSHCLFLRSPDKSVMPKSAEVNDGFDICGKPLKTSIRRLFPGFYFFTELLKSLNCAKKYAGASQASCLSICFYVLQSCIKILQAKMPKLQKTQK